MLIGTVVVAVVVVVVVWVWADLTESELGSRSSNTGHVTERCRLLAGHLSGGLN
jgi:hypothetical protein